MGEASECQTGNASSKGCSEDQDHESRSQKEVVGEIEGLLEGEESRQKVIDAPAG